VFDLLEIQVTTYTRKQGCVFTVSLKPMCIYDLQIITCRWTSHEMYSHGNLAHIKL